MRVRVYRRFAGMSALEKSVSSNAVTQNYVPETIKTYVSCGVNNLKVPSAYLVKHYTRNDVLGSGGTVVGFVKYWHWVDVMA